jgi:hypothetical protein
MTFARGPFFHGVAARHVGLSCQKMRTHKRISRPSELTPPAQKLRKKGDKKSRKDGAREQGSARL